MRHASQSPELLLEAQDGRGLGPLQGLEGHDHAALLVECFVDDPHAPAAQLAYDPIAAQPSRVSGGLGRLPASVSVLRATDTVV